MTDTTARLEHLEVCVDRIDAALAAERAGATRIELNVALVEDGLTPSHGVCEAVCAATSVPVIAMIRPHNDGFVYSDHERISMLRDARLLLGICDGIAIGALTKEGKLDKDLLLGVCEVRNQVSKQRGLEAKQLELVMHRAFEFAADLERSLEALIDLGFDRVLTSGGAENAVEGVDSLRRLLRQSAGRIEILPGCGVRSGNAASIALHTGATQLHGSFRILKHPFVDERQIQHVATLLEP